MILFATARPNFLLKDFSKVLARTFLVKLLASPSVAPSAIPAIPPVRAIPSTKTKEVATPSAVWYQPLSFIKSI